MYLRPSGYSGKYFMAALLLGAIKRKVINMQGSRTYQ